MIAIKKGRLSFQHAPIDSINYIDHAPPSEIIGSFEAKYGFFSIFTGFTDGTDNSTIAAEFFVTIVATIFLFSGTGFPALLLEKRAAFIFLAFSLISIPEIPLL
jgi:hypothetical protein